MHRERKCVVGQRNKYRPRRINGQAEKEREGHTRARAPTDSQKRKGRETNAEREGICQQCPVQSVSDMMDF